MIPMGSIVRYKGTTWRVVDVDIECPYMLKEMDGPCSTSREEVATLKQFDLLYRPMEERPPAQTLYERLCDIADEVDDLEKIKTKIQDLKGVL